MGLHALSLDWRISMAHARALVGPQAVLAGNVDPMVLYGGPERIESAVKECLLEAGLGGRHVLNLGHGVEQDIPEDAVRHFVEMAHKHSTAVK